MFIYAIFCDFSESDRKNEADGFDQVGNNPCNSEYRRSIFFYPFMNIELNLSQWLATGWCFSPGPAVSSTNKTNCHDITEISLKVALNTT